MLWTECASCHRFFHKCWIAAFCCFMICIFTVREHETNAFCHDSEKEGKFAFCIFLKGKPVVPQLTGSVPIKLVAEIAVEKLRRDYLAFFLDNHPSTLRQVERLVASPSGASDEETLLSRFDGLLKLHHVVELAVHCSSSLNLPRAKVLPVVR